MFLPPSRPSRRHFLVNAREIMFIAIGYSALLPLHVHHTGPRMKPFLLLSVVQWPTRASNCLHQGQACLALGQI